MSIYLTSSLPPSPYYSHLDLNPDFSGFESGFPPNSDCQNTNEYLHPTQSMKICVSVCVYSHLSNSRGGWNKRGGGVKKLQNQ